MTGGGGGEGGHGRFHVAGPRAPTDSPSRITPPKGSTDHGRGIAGRHHVGMAGKTDDRPSPAPARQQVRGAAAIDAHAVEAPRRSAPGRGSASAPPSAGVTEGQRTSSAASATGSIAIAFLPAPGAPRSVADHPHRGHHHGIVGQRLIDQRALAGRQPPRPPPSRSARLPSALDLQRRPCPPASAPPPPSPIAASSLAPAERAQQLRPQRPIGQAVARRAPDADHQPVHLGPGHRFPRAGAARISRAAAR
ncbi:MAG: hypothetical protein KatS3mg118_0897 [Paracoccaceae bacterium]|nr:MAG: hypothetical protein KatS3mg118_0897 [Paracoccaceae bacterium]